MFDMGEMQKRVDAGLIKAIPDPMGTGLSIYDYTMQCSWERAWDEYTLASRGLVLDDKGNVFARPFQKFFNHGEPDAQIKAGAPEFFEKYDGSLVIVFHDGGGWRVNTRGSWQSDQAKAASAWIFGKLRAEKRDVPFVQDYTYCMEYVAPDNRVVVPYEREQCIMLAAFANWSGCEQVEHAQDVAVRAGIALAKGFGARDIASFNPAECSDHSREGYVAVWPCGHRVKLKFAEYFRMHKIVTGLSVKGIWEGLRAGKAEMPEGLPDEFMAWYAKERSKLEQEFGRREGLIDTFFAIAASRACVHDRKVFALHVKQNAPAWAVPCLFQRLDGKDYSDTIWKQLEPKGKQTWKVDDE